MPSQLELQRCVQAYQRLKATRSDLFRRAVEYNRRGNSVSDPAKRLIYKRLRDMWIWLACEGPNDASDLIAGDIAAIEEIKSILDDGKNSSIH
jgi:hypothetical protein